MVRSICLRKVVQAHGGQNEVQMKSGGARCYKLFFSTSIEKLTFYLREMEKFRVVHSILHRKKHGVSFRVNRVKVKIR